MPGEPEYAKQFEIAVNSENREFVKNQYRPSKKCNSVVFFDVKRGASGTKRKCKRYNLGHREIPYNWGHKHSSQQKTNN